LDTSNHDTTQGVDHVAVAALAQYALATLRLNGLSNEEIREGHYLQPNPADARFDNQQHMQRGYVPIPAALIKREMRRLLTN
jgi:hypothetical protein